MDSETFQMKPLMDENARLREENTKLKAELEASRTPRHENGAVYFLGEDQPFCGTCYGKDSKKVPLIAHRESSVFICKGCGATPPRPGAIEHEGGAFPRQPGDNVLKGSNYASFEIPSEWEDPNR